MHREEDKKEIYQHVNSGYYWIVMPLCVSYIFYSEHVLISQTEKKLFLVDTVNKIGTTFWGMGGGEGGVWEDG